MTKGGRCWAVIAAAGVGRRCRQRKQHLFLAGKTVLRHALSCFIAHPAIAGVAVALGDDEEAEAAGLTGPGMDKVTTVTGGATRCQSVLNGLRALSAADDDLALVHDAARPCLAMEDLDALIEAAWEDTGGALLATPVGDSLKRVDPEGRRALGSVDRDGLWRALTPQAFRYGHLLSSLRQALDAGRTPRDEAEAVEWAGGEAPRLIKGRSDNIKITYEEDLDLARAILEARPCTA